MKNPNHNPKNAPQNTAKNIMRTLVENRRANFEYIVIERFKAGIVLKGTEVKSIWAGKVNLSDAYCFFDKNAELYVRNLHISEYPNAGKLNNHQPKADRKLLLKKRELRKLQTKVKERGLTIAPLELFLNERDLIKVEVALVKGKKSYDKRDSIKEKDMKRETQRSLKME